MQVCDTRSTAQDSMGIAQIIKGDGIVGAKVKNIAAIINQALKHSHIFLFHVRVNVRVNVRVRVGVA